MDIGVENAISIWNYEHLPEFIKEFMKEGNISIDDADWFALKPSVYKNDYIPWLEEPQFGCCAVDEYPMGDSGDTLVVGYHS